MLFRKVLIANRGAIATRISRTLRRLGIAPIAVYSDADRYAPHVLEADAAVYLGPAPASESYLRGDAIIEAARSTGAQAIHPGYGFLSENADFAERCEQAGIAFIGPTPRQMRDFGLKHTAREIAESSGVPLLPGSGLLADVAEAQREAARIGFPVMLKSTAGGGGIGMRRCDSAAELSDGYETVARLARTNFKDAGLYLEKLVERARHVEVQIFGDGAGEVVALGERDCSLQRRNQKVIEETPAPGLGQAVRQALGAAAVGLGRSAHYRSAGTVEFVMDAATNAFYFLEVNTRIQVEHGITEEVTGVDLVEWMVRLAAGQLPRLTMLSAETKGFAIEARLYAEDPARGFQPSCGALTRVTFPRGVRVETWVEAGTEITPYYDPMIAKVIARGATRAESIERLRTALCATQIDGVETNRGFLIAALDSEAFRAGDVHTRLLEGVTSAAPSVEVVDPGTQTTVQDVPGRLGYWAVGVPPSGPMDDLSFRIGNRLVGNPNHAAGLECTMVGPSLRFRSTTMVALTGADMGATLDGAVVPRYRPITVPAGGVLRLGAVRGAGCRAYVAIQGGIDVPAYLGSRSTFTLGLFGGHAGRALRVGDVLHVGESAPGVDAPAAITALGGGASLSPALALAPTLSNAWTLAVLHGPQSAPDFFTPADIETLFGTAWVVHHNSNRTGVRLIGPKPTWARKDGGEAGLHPSNIHDNAYAIGTIDFTGDMPVILGPDGPSLGGFVCPATVVAADLWKLGQLKAGDTVTFRAVTLDEARQRRALQEDLIATLDPRLLDGADGISTPGSGGGGVRAVSPPSSDAVLLRLPETAQRPAVAIRQDGDANLLIEYGPMVLDLALRFRVHALAAWLEQHRVPGIVDLTPGIRSLHVHYDDTQLPRERLLEMLARAEAELPATDEIEVPSRVVHLPLSWDDAATRLAIQKYTQSVRPDAPWCPSNIEFIRRINGLDDVDQVRDIVFAASYLVLGLGDVYLGAPVATPTDPRHRLVTTKYNPARTWTPENAVGIGGAYLCVYGMEGPGGYQFVGRTCQMWNRLRQTGDFTEGKPWLLRFFDQIRFFPVSETDLLAFREEFPRGRVKLRIEQTTFKFAAYRAFLNENQTSIDTFKRRQQAAFEAERERWALMPPPPDLDLAAGQDESGTGASALQASEVAVRADVTSSVWQLAIEVGARVAAGDRLMILESMKMEIPVTAPVSGVVSRLLARPGGLVSAGQMVAVISTEPPPG